MSQTGEHQDAVEDVTNDDGLLTFFAFVPSYHL